MDNFAEMSNFIAMEGLLQSIKERIHGKKAAKSEQPKVDPQIEQLYQTQYKPKIEALGKTLANAVKSMMGNWDHLEIAVRDSDPDLGIMDDGSYIVAVYLWQSYYGPDGDIPQFSEREQARRNDDDNGKICAMDLCESNFNRLKSTFDARVKEIHPKASIVVGTDDIDYLAINFNKEWLKDATK